MRTAPATRVEQQRGLFLRPGDGKTEVIVQLGRAESAGARCLEQQLLDLIVADGRGVDRAHAGGRVPMDRKLQRARAIAPDLLQQVEGAVRLRAHVLDDASPDRSTLRQQVFEVALDQWARVRGALRERHRQRQRSCAARSQPLRGVDELLRSAGGVDPLADVLAIHPGVRRPCLRRPRHLPLLVGARGRCLFPDHQFQAQDREHLVQGLNGGRGCMNLERRDGVLLDARFAADLGLGKLQLAPP